MDRYVWERLGMKLSLNRADLLEALQDLIMELRATSVREHIRIGVAPRPLLLSTIPEFWSFSAP